MSREFQFRLVERMGAGQRVSPLPRIHLRRPVGHCEIETDPRRQLVAKRRNVMKTLLSSVFLTSTLVLGASGLMAQSGVSELDQRFKAKYGVYTPQTEARFRAERANSASREEASGPPARPNWIERHYKAKYGRNTPAEEARLKAERDNSASREEPAKTEPAKSWIDQWYKAKFGRYAPQEEARLKAAGK